MSLYTLSILACHQTYLAGRRAYILHCYCFFIAHKILRKKLYDAIQLGQQQQELQQILASTTHILSITFSDFPINSVSCIVLLISWYVTLQYSIKVSLDFNRDNLCRCWNKYERHKKLRERWDSVSHYNKENTTLNYGDTSLLDKSSVDPFSYGVVTTI